MNKMGDFQFPNLNKFLCQIQNYFKAAKKCLNRCFWGVLSLLKEALLRFKII